MRSLADVEGQGNAPCGDRAIPTDDQAALGGGLARPGTGSLTDEGEGGDPKANQKSRDRGVGDDAAAKFIGFGHHGAR